jgi:hypothetical protein
VGFCLLGGIGSSDQQSSESSSLRLGDEHNKKSSPPTSSVAGIYLRRLRRRSECTETGSIGYGSSAPLESESSYSSHPGYPVKPSQPKSPCSSLQVVQLQHHQQYQQHQQQQLLQLQSQPHYHSHQVVNTIAKQQNKNFNQFHFGDCSVCSNRIWQLSTN